MLKQTGFSLLEVIISILIFSIALLGLDALGILTLRENLSTYYTSLAVQQIQNIEERLSALGSSAGTEEQIKLWNLQNQTILPFGKGKVAGQYPQYAISLCWGNSVSDVRSGEKTGCIQEEFSVQ